MKPYLQTTETNCFPTCLAAIAELPLDEVPKGISPGQGLKQYYYLTQGLLDKYGLGLIGHDQGSYPSEGYWVADVPLDKFGRWDWREGHVHCIIMNGTKFEWDVSFIEETKRRRKPNKIIRGWSLTDKENGMNLREFANHIDDTFLKAGGREWAIGK